MQSRTRQDVTDESKALYAILEEVASFYEQALSKAPQARTYLLNRGIDASTQKRYRLGFAPHLPSIF